MAEIGGTLGSFATSPNIRRIECPYTSSKNISVRDDVYRALKEAKADEESFSDVIERLLGMDSGEHPLYDLVGTLDEREAEEVRGRISEFRERVDDGMGAGE